MISAKKKKAESMAHLTLDEVLRKTLPHGYRPMDTRCFISTGVDLLDWALGGRGFPCGRIIEIYSLPFAGKTTTAIQAVRSTLMQGGKAVYMDTESGVDLNWVRKLGVDPGQVHWASPLWLEELHSVVEGTVECREKETEPTLIVWDSVAMTLAKEYVENALDKAPSPAMEARLNARFFGRPWVQRMQNSSVCLLMLNQPRANIGVMWGPKDSTPGGRALRHAASIRMSLTKGPDIEEAGQVVGHIVTASIHKNRMTGRSLDVDICHTLDMGMNSLLTSVKFAFDQLKTAQGRLVYKGKSWFQKDLYRYLVENEVEAQAFRYFVQQLWMGETPESAEE